MKRVLIVGENSYIGGAIKKWLEQPVYSGRYQVDIVSSLNRQWERAMTGGYDVVVNVAGIAHRKIKKNMESLFYQVNRDLAEEICLAARNHAVSQYIYLSSMNVFGDTNEKICSDTIPAPKNFYGKSKLEADQKIQALTTDDFHTVSIRPPVVYGKDCKGNFPLLVKGARYLPIFPDYNNIRSLLYIDNLCEFIRLCMDHEVTGIYHPQNRDQISTSGIVRIISQHLGHKIFFTKIFNKLIFLLMPKIRFLQRTFDDDYYAPELSDVFDYQYCVVDLRESITRSL